MLTKTPSWTTSDGKVHTNYANALKHELTTMFAKHADSDVIAKKLVESMTPPFIDRAVEIMQLIKAELNEPSHFEVREIEKPFVTGIDDLPKNESLGTVGGAAEDLNQNVLELSQEDELEPDPAKVGSPISSGTEPVAEPKVFADPRWIVDERDAA